MSLIFRPVHFDVVELPDRMAFGFVWIKGYNPDERETTGEDTNGQPH